MEDLTHDSLKKVAKMAEEMEDKIDILEFQRDDLLGMYERKEEENTRLKNDILGLYETNEDEITRLKNEIELLECKTDCLEHQLRGITRDNAELLGEAQRSRASFTKLQVAVSVIIFAYGWLYGSFFCPA